MGGRVGGQGGCERRMEVFGKIDKQIGGGGGSGRGSGGGSGWWGVRVDVNAIMGWVVMWGMGTKNRRYCTIYKKVLCNIKKIKKKMWEGEEEGQYLNPKHSLCI